MRVMPRSTPTRTEQLMFASGALVIAVLGLFPLATAWWTASPLWPLRAVLLAACLALGARSIARLPRSVEVALAGMLVALMISSALGSTPLLSMLGRYPRYEGLPYLAVLVLLLGLGSGMLTIDQTRHRTLAVQSVVGAGSVLALQALWQVISDTSTRPVTTLGNASDVGGFGVLTAALAMAPTPSLASNRWRGAGILAAALLVGLSGSRGAWLALVLMLALALVLGRPRLRATLTAVCCLAGLTVVVVLASPLARTRLTGSSPMSSATVTGRELLWRESLRLWGSHPFVGVGPSRFVDTIGGFHDGQWAATVGPANPPDAPHNVVLQVLCSTGMVGLVAALGVCATVGLTLWRNRSDGWSAVALLVLSGEGTVLMFHLSSPLLVVPTVFLLGGALPLGDRPHRVSLERVRSAMARVCAVGLLVWALTLLRAESILADGVRQAAAGELTAGTTLARAGHIQPWDPDLARRAGHALNQLGFAGQSAPDAPLAVLAPACARIPGSTECALDLADAQQLAGQSNSAEGTLNRARSLDPTNADVVLRLGVLEAEAQRWAQAEEYFLAATRLSPAAAEPWRNLAQLYTLMGRVAEAQRAQEEALKRG